MRKKLLALIAGGLALALLVSAADAAPDDAGDDGVLARVLLVETSGRATVDEAAGIVHVALNRARGWRATVRDVVYSRVEGRPEWGSGCGDGACDYNRRLDAANGHPMYAHLVGQVPSYAASAENPIGARRNFIHPDHPTFQRSRARADDDQRAQARSLRRQAGQIRRADPSGAAELYRQANRVEDVHPKYAFEPALGLYLPTWSVDPTVGGQANHRPITIGRTRFS